MSNVLPINILQEEGNEGEGARVPPTAPPPGQLRQNTYFGLQQSKAARNHHGLMQHQGNKPNKINADRRHFYILCW
jgi:hypothetical protein